MLSLETIFWVIEAQFYHKQEGCETISFSKSLSERQSVIFSSILEYMADVQIVTVMGTYQLVWQKILLFP